MVQEYDDIQMRVQADPYWSNITSIMRYSYHGPSQTYKLSVRVYGGAKDDDLCNSKHKNELNPQKWVCLYNLTLDPLNGKGKLPHKRQCLHG